MPIQRLNRTWVDGELWDAADDANPIGQKIDELVDQTNLNTTEIEAARAGAIDLNTRINLLETSAAASATSAANSATIATTKANEASASATSAASSATSAATSAATATTKASEASASANLARDWAIKTSGTVEGTEYSAKYHAQQASASATSAANSANSASNSANTATTKAAEAYASATSASTSASNAASSAASAYTYMTKASEWANKTTGTVENGEYSAKYYSIVAKNEADRAQGYANSINPSGATMSFNVLKYVPRIVTSGTALTIDPTIASYWEVTVNANTTITFVNGAWGDILYVRLIQDSTGGRAINIVGNVPKLQNLPEAKGSWELYQFIWKGYWEAVYPDSFSLHTREYTNMLTQQCRQNPFKDTSVNDITGWTTGTSLPGGLHGSQAIVTKNRVYLLGGGNGSAVVSTVYTAPINSDGALGTWTTGTSLPGSLAHSQAIVTKNRVYLLGGTNGSSVFSTVYTAPINSDGTLGAWTTASSLPGGLRLSQAIVTKNRVYLLGGRDGSAVVSTVYTASFADGWVWQDPHSAYYEDNGII